MNSGDHFRSHSFGNYDLLVLEQYTIVQCQLLSIIPIFSDVYRGLFSMLWPSYKYGCLKLSAL